MGQRLLVLGIIILLLPAGGHAQNHMPFGYKEVQIDAPLSVFKKKYPEFGCRQTSKSFVECNAIGGTYAEIAVAHTRVAFSYGKMVEVSIDFGPKKLFVAAFESSILETKLPGKYGPHLIKNNFVSSEMSSSFQTTIWSRNDGSKMTLTLRHNPIESVAQTTLSITSGNWVTSKEDF